MIVSPVSPAKYSVGSRSCGGLHLLLLFVSDCRDRELYRSDNRLFSFDPAAAVVQGTFDTR